MDRWHQTDKSVRFLGITIDSRLTWKDHIDHLSNTLSKATYAIRKIEKTAGKIAARTAYFSLFQSRINYGIETWGHSSHTKAILVLQKRALRGMLGETALCSAKPLFKQERILTVYAIYISRGLNAIHRKRETAERQGDQHDYETRNRTLLKAAFSRLATTSHHYKMTTLYNMLPEEWRSAPTSRFRRRLQSHLSTTCPYSLEEFVQDLPNEPSSNIYLNCKYYYCFPFIYILISDVLYIIFFHYYRILFYSEIDPLQRAK